MTTALAPQKVVSDLVEEYNQKADALPEAIKAFEAAEPALASACTVYGAYAGSPVQGRSSVMADSAAKILLASAWKSVWDRLQIDMVASAQDRRAWEKFLAEPAPFTLVNVRDKLGPYLLDPWTNILRGLAEVFCSLDPAYKSHSKVKIGVKGLPKRVILNYWGSYSFGGARDKLRDIINAIRAYQRRTILTYSDLDSIIQFNEARAGTIAEFAPNRRYSVGAKAMKDGDLYRLEGYSHREGDPFLVSTEENKGWHRVVDLEPGIELRIFGGAQTCHVIFKPDTLLDINRALAEFYGDVLPDAEDDDEKRPARRASTEVSKDLQYYPTPAKVVARILDEIGLESLETYRYRYGNGSNFKTLRVLEPSCGDGRVLDEVRARGHKGLGIEVHPGRASEAKAKGHSVLIGNFLEVAPDPTFDAVAMNPPFYGRHYRKHLDHAKAFLKPGGVLVCILPASAWYDHGGLSGEWHDLPVASFAESGTNVPTGFLVWRAPR